MAETVMQPTIAATAAVIHVALAMRVLLLLLDAHRLDGLPADQQTESAGMRLSALSLRGARRATKQSLLRAARDCFASLAMTRTATHSGSPSTIYCRDFASRSRTVTIFMYAGELRQACAFS